MLAHNVSAEVRRAISRGEFAPGQKLNEVALAERFGVSRNTLREAFAMLTAEGLCERIPNRGVFLATPTPEFVTDTFRARAAIEPAALLWGPDLDVDRLDELNKEARVAIEEEDDDLLIAVNQAFHHVVLAAMGSKTLGDTMDQLDAFLRLSRTEGIIPALESAHAVAHAMAMAPTMPRDSYLLVNLSGRGDKDMDHVAEQLGMGGEPDTVADAPAASLNV